jgi:hypothetical protein
VGSLTLWEEHKLREFKNMALRISGPKREEIEDCIMRSFITYALHKILLG